MPIGRTDGQPLSPCLYWFSANTHPVSSSRYREQSREYCWRSEPSCSTVESLVHVRLPPDAWASKIGCRAASRAGLFIAPVSATMAPYKDAGSLQSSLSCIRLVFPMAAPRPTSAGSATKSGATGRDSAHFSTKSLIGGGRVSVGKPPAVPSTGRPIHDLVPQPVSLPPRLVVQCHSRDIALLPSSL
jgi:hypothetical protein